MTTIRGQRGATLALLAALVLLAAGGGAAQGPAPPVPTTRLKLEAGDTASRQVVVEAPVLAPRTARTAALVATDGRVAIAQVVGEGTGQRLVWVEELLRPGQTREYTVRFERRPRADGGVVVAKPGEDSVEVTVDGRLLTRYVFKGAPKPYLYPVMGPGGKQLNRDYPMKNVAGEDQDHPHQRSLWFTHGAVNGVDFWAEGPGKGRVVHRRFRTLESGPVMGRIVAEADWVTPQGEKLLDELTELRFIKTPGGPLIDYQVTLTALADSVTFGDTKEGTFGFRVASTMDVTKKQGGRIATSTGLTDTAAWGKRAEWVDYSGPVGGERLGIAILDHPSSFRHPTHWHVRDYGLFAANPFGIHDFEPGKPATAGNHTLKKGESLTFRYRLYPHRGDEKEARVAEVYAGFARPPVLSAGG